MTPFQWPGFTRMNCASRFLLAAVGVLLGVDGFQTCLELHSVLSCSTFGKQLFIILQFGGAHLHVPSIARERRKKTDCRVLVNHASHDLPSRGSFWAPSPPSLRGWLSDLLGAALRSILQHLWKAALYHPAVWWRSPTRT